jgi:hypothetical protein
VPEDRIRVALKLLDWAIDDAPPDGGGEEEPVTTDYPVLRLRSIG